MVYNGATELVQGTDYNVIYKNNIEKGEATVVIEGIGEYYTGSCEEYYEIIKELNEDEIVLNNTGIEYTGKEWNVKPIVKDGDKILVENEDYTLGYTDNVNAGTATIYIKGINTYCGVVTKNFEISHINVSKLTFRLVYKGTEGNSFKQKYKNEEIKPTVEVFIPYNKKLTLEDNFEISYKNSNKLGTAEITLQGKANVTGIIKLNYEIKDGYSIVINLIRY